MVFSHYLLFFICLLATGVAAFPQQGYEKTKDSVTIIAGKQLQKGPVHNFLWGKHYREDWATPVKLKQLNLDTVDGGLTAYQQGGGRQTKSLRLRNPDGKEYVLRSIAKTYTKALSDTYQGTFVEKVMNDQVSMGEPYSAITISPMAEIAGIYHTNPQIVFVPQQKALGEFSEEFGNKVYLLEQRPDENWEGAANFGNSKKIISTENLLENIFEKNSRRVDQLAYVRARLFDIFIGDWGRQEDQWRWAEIDEGDKELYRPIPRDRDQAYTKLDGVLLSAGIAAAGAGHLESFNSTIKNVAEFNYPARNLDRQFANETTKDQWVAIAKDLQQKLTDAVIEEAIQKLPPEVFPNSGNEIITKLKARRGHLQQWAEEYYLSLAKEVEIVGTQSAESFRVIQKANGEVDVAVYDLDKEGQSKKNPFYSRKFLAGETEEIRLYGFAGDDQFLVTEEAENPIRIRLIGGPGRNRYEATTRNNKVHIYDDDNNDLTQTGNVKKHLSDNPFIHVYDYDAFKYDSKGFSPSLYYTSEDHIHAGLKFKIEKQQWRKYPFGYEHSFGLRYSLSEKAFSAEYKGTVTKFISNWDLLLNAGYDFIRWNNYYGIGNKTEMLTTERDYHRVRSREGWGSMGIRRLIGYHHSLTFTAQYQYIKLINDETRFLNSHVSEEQDYNDNHFGIGKVDYLFQNLDNGILPTKGMKILSTISFTQNLQQKDSTVAKYSAMLNFFLPLTRSFVLSVKAGGATLDGKPKFYQLNRLGGGATLRGYRKYRFHGETMAYNQNELQFIPNVKTFLFNGKAGILGFFDIGRVWQPGEISDDWHTGYGGGIIISPFNKIAVIATYGLSKNEHDITIRVTKALK